MTGIQRGSAGSLEQTCGPGANVLKIRPTLLFASENVAKPVSALVMKPLHKTIQPDVEAALAVVMTRECARLHVDVGKIPARGQSNLNPVKSLGRGQREPGAAEFFTFAWSLHEDPRELFDKPLTQMRLPPGSRPVPTG